ncbi:MAG TPA: signal peptidase I [Actinomycetota bacterium]
MEGPTPEPSERDREDKEPGPPSETGREQEAARGRTRDPMKAVLGFFRELPGLLLLAFILALLIKTFLIQAFYIPSGSMEHTLDVGDRVLVNKVVYHIHPPRRGDIIVFSDPHPIVQHRSPLSAVVHWLTDGLGISRDPNKDFIKRVIGLPGETVEVTHGIVFIDGKRLSEHYLGPVISTADFTDTVPRGRLFVMGDNRGDSNDSRGTLGDIPLDKVIGRAFVTIWPPSRIGLLRRPDYGAKFASARGKPGGPAASLPILTVAAAPPSVKRRTARRRAPSRADRTARHGRTPRRLRGSRCRLAHRTVVSSTPATRGSPR